MTTLPPAAEQYRYAHGHASQRLRERYGLDVGLLEFTRLCLDIAERSETGLQALQPLARAGGGPDRWVIRWRIQGQNVNVVWCNENKVIITALERHMRGESRGTRMAWRKKHGQIQRRREQRRKERL